MLCGNGAGPSCFVFYIFCRRTVRARPGGHAGPGSAHFRPFCPRKVFKNEKPREPIQNHQVTLPGVSPLKCTVHVLRKPSRAHPHACRGTRGTAHHIDTGNPGGARALGRCDPPTAAPIPAGRCPPVAAWARRGAGWGPTTNSCPTASPTPARPRMPPAPGLRQPAT